ncbi:hypothetical protein M0812_00679 [Anaeramoeba flamelloides]|uniref:Uncharacterized protein n=1 Tax=Anaeramoeba flamelloides TaxID=1746091 RepID=A0AAV8A6P6_9EUKA|nr:hypothetical protein M0812_00679 [Anaeramoeba flamelloides]
MLRFFHSNSKALPKKLLIHPICSTLLNDKDFEETISEFKQYLPNELIKIDAQNQQKTNAFFLATGGTERQLMDLISKWSLQNSPIFVFTNSYRNSLPAGLELKTRLNQEGQKSEIIHIPYDTRPGEYSNELKNKLDWIPTCNEIKSKVFRVGVFGKPSDWLLADLNILTDKYLLDNYNLQIENIPISSVIKGMGNRNISPREFKSFKNEFADRFGIKQDLIPNRELDQALKIYLSLKNLVNDYQLDGITVRCFDLLGSVHSTSCLAFAQLNAEGIVSACEGDIECLYTMLINKYLGNVPNTFMANVQDIDVKKNTLALAHCTLPFGFSQSGSLNTHFESGIGVAVQTDIPRNIDCTISRFNLQNNSLLSEHGKTIDHTHVNHWCRSQMRIKFNPNQFLVKKLFEHPFANHKIVANSNIAQKLKFFHNLWLK